MKKRYEYISSDGIRWTNWFECTSDTKEPYQLKGKLKNEYK